MFGLPMEVFVSLASGLGGFIMKMQAQKTANQQELMKLAIQKQEAHTKSADAASKRSNPVLRKFAAMTILLVAFVGLFIVAFFPDIPVSIIEETDSKSLFGLIEYGGGTRVTTVNGLALPPYWQVSVMSVISFLFGTGAAKVSK
jgi:multidrug efflux pump subunit AcrB